MKNKYLILVILFASNVQAKTMVCTGNGFVTRLEYSMPDCTDVNETCLNEGTMSVKYRGEVLSGKAYRSKVGLTTEAQLGQHFTPALNVVLIEDAEDSLVYTSKALPLVVVNKRTDAIDCRPIGWPSSLRQ